MRARRVPAVRQPWAMEPSWVRTRCPGYEVKVSRGDYAGDRKWTGYLDYCTEFYFVCPAGLIKPEELPPQVGLLWGTANGGRVYQKKPAIPREIDPEHLAVMLRHVLMWRLERGRRPGDVAARWLDGAAHGDQDESYRLHNRIRTKIRQMADKDAAGLREENERLAKEQKPLQQVRDWLAANGIEIEGNEHGLLGDVQGAVRERREAITKKMRDLVWPVSSLAERLADLARDLKDGKEGEDG